MSGQQNVLIGAYTGYNCVDLDQSVIIGYNAGVGGGAALKECVAIGVDAFNSTAANAQTGTVAIGYNALTALTEGEGNVAIGYQALDAEDDGDFNTAVGYQALTAQTGVSGHVANTAIGYQAGVTLLDGSDNTALGMQALRAEDGGNRSTAIGTQALFSQATTSPAHINNVGVGAFAGYRNVTGTNNTYVGTSAGEGTSGGAVSNSYNTGVGSQALKAITDGEQNTAVGYQAGKLIDVGTKNTLIGYQAGYDLEEGDEEGRSLLGMVQIGAGFTGLITVIVNLFYGLGNFVATCPKVSHDTCGVSMKLNWMDFFRMDEYIAWSESGSIGIPDVGLAILCMALMWKGIRK